MNLTADTFYHALPGLLAAASAFAVCLWRIGDLTRRVATLEAAKDNHSDRVMKIETQLESIGKLLERIAVKLNVN